MLDQLIEHSSDIRKLVNDGYAVEILDSAYIRVHGIPYVNSNREPQTGILICKLDNLSGFATTPKPDHVAFFKGDHPCDASGIAISSLTHPNGSAGVPQGLDADHAFSNQPPEGYDDYYDLLTGYIALIEPHAIALKPSMTSRLHAPIAINGENSPFKYVDTNSTRAEILTLNAKLKGHKVAIIGLGGTGSYVLDFVAKTHVSEIHLYDDDIYQTHNAFRSPGAPKIDTLNAAPSKVEYLADIYANMKPGIHAHKSRVGNELIDEITNYDSVFICIDDTTSKKLIVDGLMAKNVPFIDVGIGMELVGDKLDGRSRVTIYDGTNEEAVRESLSLGANNDDDYSANVQIAEINAFNAACAVIRWKKLLGFYHDFANEHDSIYDINSNLMTNYAV